MRAFLLLVFIALVLASGCATFKELKGADYRDSAHLNFEEGMKYLHQEEYEVAEKYFQLVKDKFAFSMYAKTAELLIGDTLYMRDMHAEAIDAYKRFQRSHPDHACVPYTQFMVAEAYYDQIVEDWWFMPPVYEKDQETTEKALDEYRRLLYMMDAQNYKLPDDFKPARIVSCTGVDSEQERSYVMISREKIRFCLRRLVDREVYVADYYIKRDKPRGAVGRLEGAVKRFPAIADDLDILLKLAKAYEKADMYDKAGDIWKKLKELHPDAGGVKGVDLDKKLKELENEKLAFEEAEKKNIADERTRMIELRKKEQDKQQAAEAQ